MIAVENCSIDRAQGRPAAHKTPRSDRPKPGRIRRCGERTSGWDSAPWGGEEEPDADARSLVQSMALDAAASVGVEPVNRKNRPASGLDTAAPALPWQFSVDQRDSSQRSLCIIVTAFRAWKFDRLRRCVDFAVIGAKRGGGARQSKTQPKRRQALTGHVLQVDN